MASSPSGSSSSSSSASAVFLHFEFLQNSAFEVRGRERERDRGDHADSLTVTVLFTMPRSLASHARFISDPSFLAVHPRIKVATSTFNYVYSDDFPFFSVTSLFNDMFPAFLSNPVVESVKGKATLLLGSSDGKVQHKNL